MENCSEVSEGCIHQFKHWRTWGKADLGSGVSMIPRCDKPISWPPHDRQASRVRSGTLLVWGIWQRPERCLGEYGATELLQHHSGKTEPQRPHSEEGGGLRDGYKWHLLVNLQVNAPVGAWHLFKPSSSMFAWLNPAANATSFKTWVMC